MKRLRIRLMLPFAILALAGCQTSFWESEAPADAQTAPAESSAAPASTDLASLESEPAYSPIFTPSACIAQIKAEKGPCPTLFDLESTAIWVGPEVAAYKRKLTLAGGGVITPNLEKDAQEILEKYAVVECSLESAFGDASIAYDVVGLRGVSASLTAGEGHAVAPAQVLPGALRPQEQRGALKVFRRDVLLVFPLYDAANKPLVPRGAKSVRLTLDYQNARFYFEWPAGPEQPLTWDERVRGALSYLDYNELFGKVQRFAHVFD